MISIKDKHKCCGCSACVQICPKKCIEFKEDEKGFSYPHVQLNLCIDCGLCEKVCPCLNQDSKRKPIKVFMAINPNESVRAQSSSGGVFSLFAEKIVDDGGVVFGVRFNDDWDVVHDCVENKEELGCFRGSKYVQSIIGESYIRAQRYLKEGRKVLFSGTSCQVAGLKRFLGKEYENLLTIDVVCHGVPSPLVWREYLDLILRYSKKEPCSIQQKNNKHALLEVSFREKSYGWKKFSFVAKVQPIMDGVIDQGAIDAPFTLVHESLYNNLFLQIFLKNLCLRPSCYSCPAKKGTCGSDITVADFWGINEFAPEWDDDRGTSAVLVNTEKAMSYFDCLNVNKEETSYEKVFNCNRSIERSVKETKYTSLFWDSFFKNGLSKSWDIVNMVRPSRIKHLYSFFRSIINKINAIHQ